MQNEYLLAHGEPKLQWLNITFACLMSCVGCMSFIQGHSKAVLTNI